MYRELGMAMSTAMFVVCFTKIDAGILREDVSYHQGEMSPSIITVTELWCVWDSLVIVNPNHLHR